VISQIFIAHNLIAYSLALLIYLYGNFGIDVYQLIENYSDGVPAFGYNIALMILSFSIGGLVNKKLYPIRMVQLPLPQKKIKRTRWRIGYGQSFFLILINITLMYGVLGSDFLQRQTYHDLLGENATLMLISKAAILVSIILIHGHSSIIPALRWFLIFFLVTLSLNYSSVMSSGYVLAIMVYDFMIFGRRSISRTVAYIIITMIVMMCAVYFRGLDEQGILNYLTNFQLDDYLELSGFTLYYIWPFSTYVSLATEALYEPTLMATIIMLNPLPGALAGWPSISESMVVQFNVPYSTIGMVFATGTWFAIAFYFALGFIFGYFDRTVAYLLNRQSKLLPLIIVTLGCYITILHAAWELRSTMRIIYYCTIVALLINHIRVRGRSVRLAI
jgi:hypothetical protein